MFGLNPSQFTSTRWIIHHEFSTFTPESFNITQKCLKEESSPSPCVAAVISVLRLAHFDTDVFITDYYISFYGYGKIFERYNGNLYIR